MIVCERGITDCAAPFIPQASRRLCYPPAPLCAVSSERSLPRQRTGPGSFSVAMRPLQPSRP
eukprot:4225562-Pleurochrysis_carterae.AAC.1